MKLDPTSDAVTFIGPVFKGRNLWYGGLVGEDGAVYGICQNALELIRYDRLQPCTGTIPRVDTNGTEESRHHAGRSKASLLMQTLY